MEPAEHYEAAQINPAPSADRSELLVMTWNIKFAGGRVRFFFECGGERGWMTKEEVAGNLRGLAQKIRQTNPDVLLLQEVDVESKRCAYVDNLQWLLDHTPLNYGVYASQWRADYVPSDGVGRVDSGNAILSRWPLTDAQRLALPLIESQDDLTRYFYLRRNILIAKVDVPSSGELWLLNTHTSAFSDDGTKKKQIDRLVEELDRLNADAARFVAGGDLNVIPPGSSQEHGFADDCDGDPRFAGDDYRGEGDWLNPLYDRFTPAVSLSDYQSEQEVHFTFTGDERVFWTRKLDYVFTNARFRAGSTMTHQDITQGGTVTLHLSDHAPLSTILELSP